MCRTLILCCPRNIPHIAWKVDFAACAPKPGAGSWHILNKGIGHIGHITGRVRVVVH